VLLPIIRCSVILLLPLSLHKYVEDLPDFHLNVNDNFSSMFADEY
jgi:hypothetical protein